MKHFNGSTELVTVSSMDNAEFSRLFPGVKGRRYDSFSKWVGRAAGSAEWLPVERCIEYRSNPSKHACDARCLNATGKIMRCECSCGGANHGRGAFTSLL